MAELPLERLMGAMDAVLVASGLHSIYGAIRLIRRGRAEVPMFWTHVMLVGGLGAVLVIMGIGHFFFFGV
jgi:hypothetical protein